MMIHPTPPPPDEEYYMLDIRNHNNEASRADAECVMETGIILAIFSERRYMAIRNIHCALEQLIVRHCHAFHAATDKPQFVLDLIRPYGGLWKWTGSAFRPVRGKLLLRRICTRFRDTLRRKRHVLQQAPKQAIPQKFVLRHDTGIVQTTTTTRNHSGTDDARGWLAQSATELAPGNSFDELVKECCAGSHDNHITNTLRNDTTKEDDEDVLSDVSSITAFSGVGNPDLQDPNVVFRHAELNCLRVVCSNLRERVRLLELQLLRAPPWLDLCSPPTVDTIVAMCPNSIVPTTSMTAFMMEPEEEEGLAVEHTRSISSCTPGNIN